MSNNMNSGPAGSGALVQPADESLVTYTHVIYALHSLSVLLGIVGTATVVGSFVGSLPSIVAVVMNYVRQSDARGTFLESHFRWQIRTFWFALLWLLVVWAVSLPLFVILIGIPLLAVGLVATGIWIIYRVVRGWTALSSRRAMYV
jgi:uncharacterized membrane protein